MVIYRSTVDGWAGQSMAQLYQRYQVWLANSELADDAEEARTFAALGTAVRDDGEFFLALLQHFDRDLHWHYGCE